MDIRRIINISLVFILIISVFIFIGYIIYSIKLKNRIKYHVTNIKKHKISYLDILIDKYNNKKKKLNYPFITNIIDNVLFAFIFSIIYILISIIMLINISIPILLFFSIIGYNFNNIINYIENVKRKNYLKNDLYTVILLLNNKLKKNKSLISSIDELIDVFNGYTKLELINIKKDILLSLSIDDVINRSILRTNIKELSIIKENINNFENLLKIKEIYNINYNHKYKKYLYIGILLIILPITLFIFINSYFYNLIELILKNNISKVYGLIIINLYLLYVFIIIYLFNKENIGG